jgi:quinol monooxygenase YgiN
MARVTVGLFARLEALPGKEADVWSFLTQAQPLAEEEPDTLAWFAVQFSPNEFGIFDVFPDDDARQDHLGGPIAAELVERAPELFARKPVIENLDVIAWKILDEEVEP